MSSLLYAFGRLAYRRWRVVMLAWVFVLGLAVRRGGAVGQGTNDTFTIPGTESQQAIDRLRQTFPQASGASAQVVAVAADGDVDRRGTRRGGRRRPGAGGPGPGRRRAPRCAEDGTLLPDAQVSADGGPRCSRPSSTVPADEVTQETRDALLALRRRRVHRGRVLHRGRGRRSGDAVALGQPDRGRRARSSPASS